MTARILVIRFSSMGDVLLCTPLLRALATQLDGGAHITFLTKAASAPMVEANPHIQRLLTFLKHPSEVHLQQDEFDYVLDFQNSVASWRVRRRLHAMAFVVDKRNVAKWLYVRTKKLVLPISHIVQRYLATAAALGVSDDGLGLDYFLPADFVAPSHSAAGAVCYAIGGKYEGKVLPAPQAVALLKRVNGPVVLLGGTDDVARGDEIAAAVGGRVTNLCGQCTWHESAWLMKQCRVVLSHDTGMMHLAAALGVRVVSLWFATTPALGFAPWRAALGSAAVESSMPGRPTSKLGNRGACAKLFEFDADEAAALLNR